LKEALNTITLTENWKSLLISLAETEHLSIPNIKVGPKEVLFKTGYTAYNKTR